MSQKRLYKIEDGKMLCGVCGGIAEYFDLDPTLVRLGFVAITVMGAGSGLLGYIVAAIIMPNKNDVIR